MLTGSQKSLKYRRYNGARPIVPVNGQSVKPWSDFVIASED